jgi:ribosomal protein S18 acetylase RimI-like enzyme
MINVRPLAADEGLLLKELRLGALRESPDAFSPTYEDTRNHDDDYWHDAARAIAGSDNVEIFIAECDGAPVGLVSGKVDDKAVGHIGAMWASPDVRGKGVGKRLLLGVVEYLKQQGCQTIELTVTESNEAAISLYRSIDFQFTGNAEPLRAGSPLMNLEMQLGCGQRE